MPLTKCPTCSTDVSTDAASCPKCGHTFKAAGAFSLKDPLHLGCVVFFVLLGAFLILVLWR
jgi:uncharacterized paraquat-inducible protein A